MPADVAALGSPSRFITLGACRATAAAHFTATLCQSTPGDDAVSHAGRRVRFTPY